MRHNLITPGRKTKLTWNKSFQGLVGLILQCNTCNVLQDRFNKSKHKQREVNNILWPDKRYLGHNEICTRDFTGALPSQRSFEWTRGNLGRERFWSVVDQIGILFLTLEIGDIVD